MALLELAGSLGENQALGEFQGILGDERLEVWPESHWTRFLLTEGDGLQSCMAW